MGGFDRYGLRKLVCAFSIVVVAVAGCSPRAAAPVLTVHQARQPSR